MTEHQIDALDTAYEALCGLSNAMEYDGSTDPQVRQLWNTITFLRETREKMAMELEQEDEQVDSIGSLRFIKRNDEMFIETDDIGSEHPDRARYWEVRLDEQWVGNVIYDANWGQLMFRPSTDILSNVTLQSVTRFIEKHCSASRRERARYDAAVAQEYAASFDVKI